MRWYYHFKEILEYWKVADTNRKVNNQRGREEKYNRIQFDITEEESMRMGY